MLSFKLTTTMAASKPLSHHQNINNWFRTVTTSSTTRANSPLINRAAIPSSMATNGSRERISVIYNDGWWRLITCAHLVHNKDVPKILGFREQYQCFCFGSKRSSSPSEQKERFSRFGSSESSGLGLVDDMGSEGKGNHKWHSQDQLPSAPPQQQKQPPKLLTLPTILTLARVAAVPLLVCTFYVDSWWGTTATTSIFIAAAITDWLDGYLARKMRLGSAFGAFLDPVADKLMVAATLILLCSRPSEVAVFGQMPWLLTVPAIAIIGREITMSAVREWAASQDSKLLEAVAVNNLGKWKTATQMTALTILLATRDNSLGGPGTVVALGMALLYISAGLALWSLAVYMRKIWKVLLR